ncbi:MAG: hypothetical protein PHE55_20805 [Methylococcaceae bacterium]|nr:hypothetical protein [Methylococcaceae bacterium]
MDNSWFRMYAEFVTDPKVQMLSEADQRRFIMLLCIRCSNGDTPLRETRETFHDESIAFQLRIDIDQWLSTKQVLISQGLIDNDIEIVSWNKRQYASDTSTARVRKHRAAKRNDIETQGNVSVTPTDSDADTDTEVNTPCPTGEIDIDGKGIDKPMPEKLKAVSDRFVAFWSAYPKKENKFQSEKAWQKLSPNDGLFAKIMAALDRSKQSDQWVRDGGKYIPLASTWLNGRRFEDEISGSSSAASAPTIGGIPRHLMLADEVPS